MPSFLPLDTTPCPAPPTKSSEMEPSPPPALPQDLEREIFELAALERFSSIPALMRVAWRVNAWVEPLLYAALYVSYPHIHLNHPLLAVDAFKANLARRPDFFRDTVRHLFLRQGVEPDHLPPAQILSACTRLETLEVENKRGSMETRPQPSIAPLLPFLEQIQSLTRLHIDVADLFSALPRQDRGTKLSAFAGLTHLEMRDRLPSADICQELTCLPRLTHLALQYSLHDRGTAPLCVRILHGCSALRVLVALRPERRRGPSVERYRAIDTPRLIDNDDARFVLVMYPQTATEDPEVWLTEMRSGRCNGFWKCGEEAVARRVASGSAKGGV
ncbi:hypothetical protein C8R44DRAFT_917589 [Mycena epipterygia]|nr:hypothetical protein C8R44DRAFT_917589 [Mycena epipterygia]